MIDGLPEPKLDSIFEESKNVKDQGNELFKAQNYKAAFQKYLEASSLLLGVNSDETQHLEIILK